jgi:UPF0271 protein
MDMLSSNKKIKYILDTSSILSGKQINLDNGELITTNSVIDEIKPGGRDFRYLSYLLEKGLKIFEPKKDSIKKIIDVSKKTGDINRLSKTDIDILALSFDINNESEFNAIILTDDYSIQNISNYLKFEYINISQSLITKRFKWVYKCRGCGKIFKKNIETCTICGSTTKNIISKSKNIK